MKPKQEKSKKKTVKSTRASRVKLERVVRHTAVFDIEKELNKLLNNGHCPALIFDDDKSWCVAVNGTQPVGGKTPWTTFITDDKKMWKKTIRGAVQYAVKRYA
jgi:hypothetical protein